MAILTGAFWAILVSHIIWFAFIGTEMTRYWGMRKKLKIHARSPMLALVSGMGGTVMQLLILLYELCAEEGIVIPCKVMLYMNATFFATYPLPYLLRGLRVVIISDKAWRAKYSAVLSRKNVFMMIAGAGVLMVFPAVLLQFIARDRYGPNPTKSCYPIADWWFWWPVCIGLAVISSKLFIELSRVQDRINMSTEIIMAALAWLACSGPHFILDILDDYGIVDSPRSRIYITTLVVVVTNIQTFSIETRRSKGKIQICVQNKKKKIVVTVDEPQILAWKQKWNSSKVIMACPCLDDAFEKHVQDYLCSESYDFLKTVDIYVETGKNAEPAPQFLKFREIIDMYIMPGSELEVNIETSMRNKILKIGDELNFIIAEMEMRRDIFNPSGTEIRKMLDENLLKTFYTSTIFLNTCKRLEEDIEPEASTSTMVDEAMLNAPSMKVFEEEPMKAEDVDKAVTLSLARASLLFN